jgi:hypothetical protein
VSVGVGTPLKVTELVKVLLNSAVPVGESFVTMLGAVAVAIVTKLLDPAERLPSASTT